MAGGLQAMGENSIVFLGREWSLRGVSGVLLYLLGLAGEIFLLTSIYMVMPVGRLSWRHALIGGVTAALLWEVTRRVLVWYFGTLSQVSVVYGSLTTAIVVLFSLEIAATLLLLGAQVISEYERHRARNGVDRRAPGLRSPAADGAQSPITTPSRRGSAPPNRSAAVRLPLVIACRPLVMACSRTSAPRARSASHGGRREALLLQQAWGR